MISAYCIVVLIFAIGTFAFVLAVVDSSGDKHDVD